MEGPTAFSGLNWFESSRGSRENPLVTGGFRRHRGRLRAEPLILPANESPARARHPNARGSPPQSALMCFMYSMTTLADSPGCATPDTPWDIISSASSNSTIAGILASILLAVVAILAFEHGLAHLYAPTLGLFTAALTVLVSRVVN